MGSIFSKQFITIILLIILVLVWSSVWSLFRIAMEAIPPLSFRVIIGIPAFVLLLTLGYKKVRSIKIPNDNIKSLLLISFFNVTLWHVVAWWQLRRSACLHPAAGCRGSYQCFQFPGLGHAGKAGPDLACRQAGHRQAGNGDRLCRRGGLSHDPGIRLSSGRRGAVCLRQARPAS